MTPTIKELWEDFKAQTIPDRVPAVQKHEMRKAFYAGVLSLLSVLPEIDESVSTQAGAEILRAWGNEVVNVLTMFALLEDARSQSHTEGEP